MSEPIDDVLDRLCWADIPESGDRGLVLPYAVKEAVLAIGGKEIRVFQLNNGQRVLDADDVHSFFAEMEDEG